MFICGEGHISKPGEKCTLVPVEKRYQKYTNIKGKVSNGWEIVREQSFCQEHAAKFEEEAE